MAKNSIKRLLRNFFSLLLLSSLAGCDYFNNKNVTDTAEKSTHEKKESAPVAQNNADTSQVLCKINGNPAITENDFITNITQMLNSNPYFGGAGIDSLPNSIKRKFFDELIKQELIITAQKNQSIETDPQFTKALEDMIKLVKRSLMVEFFQKSIFDSLNINESKVSTYFKENKEKYIKTPGGTLLSAVSFDSDEKAAAFLKKAQENIENFSSLAKEEKDGSLREFGRISDNQSPAGFRPDIVPAPLKKAALALSSLPAVGSVKVDKKNYVFKVSDKQETEYYSLDEVRSQVEGMLKNMLFKEELEKKLDGLKKQYSVSINEEYFAEKEKSSDSENVVNDDDSEETEDVA